MKSFLFSILVLLWPNTASAYLCEPYVEIVDGDQNDLEETETFSSAAQERIKKFAQDQFKTKGPKLNNEHAFIGSFELLTDQKFPHEVL